MVWRKHFGITRPVYATLSDCSERTLATIEKRRRLALNKERALNEARRLVLALAEIMEPENIGNWLEQKNEWFGKTPLQVIEDGKVDQIWEMIYHTKEGGFL